MPPIQLSRSERASLQKLLDRPRQAGEIPADHEEKLINYELASKQVLLLFITPLGQIELFRQRFRGVKGSLPKNIDLIAARHQAMLSHPLRDEA
jgi:hypothetical protein